MFMARRFPPAVDKQGRDVGRQNFLDEIDQCLAIFRQEGIDIDQRTNLLGNAIGDARGRIVSFGGRAMNPDARAKYLNGPETELFHKGRTLYGLAEARKLMASAGEDAALVVVEELRPL